MLKAREPVEDTIDHSQQPILHRRRMRPRIFGPRKDFAREFADSVVRNLCQADGAPVIAALPWTVSLRILSASLRKSKSSTRHRRSK